MTFRRKVPHPSSGLLNLIERDAAVTVQMEAST